MTFSGAPRFQHERSHSMRGMNCEARVAGSEAIAVALCPPMSRALVSSQGGYAVADAIEVLQNAFEVIVRHSLRRKTQMGRDLRP